MDYLSVKETAEKWGISERSVRNYANHGRVEGAIRKGKIWQIPLSADKPSRLNKKEIKNRNLLEILREEKNSKIKGGIYHKVQVDLTYNSNHIEGSTLTHEQTRYIFETNTIGVETTGVNVDDIVETANHFSAINYVIEKATKQLSESMVKEIHQILKNGTSDSRKDWFNVGAYKQLPNEVGGKETTSPEDVDKVMKNLIQNYNVKKQHTFEEIVAFHYEFEAIHPFQDGNGRVGRLIMFKELLKNNLTPFIISDDLKMFYYRGLSNWEVEKGYLLDTTKTAQDRFKKYLDYYRIKYED